jgi:hypothetical protein
MGEILVHLMESPVAPLVLLVLFWLAYRALVKQGNGIGRKVRAMEAYLKETEPDEKKRQRLTDLLR